MPTRIPRRTPQARMASDARNTSRCRTEWGCWAILPRSKVYVAPFFPGRAATSLPSSMYPPHCRRAPTLPLRRQPEKSTLERYPCHQATGSRLSLLSDNVILQGTDCSPDEPMIVFGFRCFVCVFLVG